ncbi:Neuromedin-U receptor 1 [Folsomia candida]|uniref:Neuromedin-U receptor 1 n=1 Tax=Folsomia candida TaxID=158441 RepID=A0A226EPZ2_FOLCA|nr:Neuromedin-U receptor 1 [Folsomia candida]
MSGLGELEWNETYREQYLVQYLGPKHLPYQSLIPISIVYGLIFICGLVGNFSTCIVIYKAHYMRTSTNYYLFNLAISDMATLIFDGIPTVFLPLVLLIFWEFRLPHLLARLESINDGAAFLFFVPR